MAQNCMLDKHVGYLELENLRGIPSSSSSHLCELENNLTCLNFSMEKWRFFLLDTPMAFCTAFILVLIMLCCNYLAISVLLTVSQRHPLSVI